MAHVSPKTQYLLTDNLATAIKTVISDGQNYVATGAIRTPRADIKATVPMIDISINGNGKASNQMMYISSLSAWAYNHYAADVQIDVATDRTDGGALHHEDICSSVRYLMSYEARSLVSPVVTWFEVMDIEDTGEATDVDEEQRIDYTRLNYRIQYGLLPSVYAVPTVGHAT